MSFYRSIILLTLLLFCSFYSGAQDNNYVYQDTAILYADSVEAAEATAKVKKELVTDQTAEDENYNEHIADTILRDNELSIEPDSIRVLKNSKSFAYAKKLDSLLKEYRKRMEAAAAPEKNNLSLLERFFLSPLTKYFFWILAGVFVSFILYKLFFTEGFFQRSYARANVTGLPDEQENLSQTADYGRLIAQAVSNRNYRIAVRYHYLQSLQKLSLKGAIQFAADKTNYQYLGELTGKTYKHAFASLTLHYEYIWYGEFEIDENVFNAIQNKFKQFNNEV